MTTADQREIVATARRINEMVDAFPPSFHTRLIAFCQSDLPSARIFQSKAQATVNVVSSALSLEDVRALHAFVLALNDDFHASSDHFIAAAVARYYCRPQPPEPEKQDH